MRWIHPEFFHFRADADELAKRLPPELVLDRFGDDALLSVVSLRVHGPGPIEYEQLNIRTYATDAAGERGIWLLDTRVDRRLPAVGARLVGMPYHVEKPLIAPLDAIAHGDWRDVEPGLEAFLLERYFAFGRLGGLTWAMQVQHAPWRVRVARAMGQVPARFAGIRVEGDPIAAHIAETREVNLRAIHHIRAAEMRPAA